MKHEHLHVEVEAEKLDTAVEKALRLLDCTRAEADIEILQVHSSGFLGLFGKKAAKVSVKVHDRGVVARQFTRQLLLLSDFDAEVLVEPSRNSFVLSLQTEEPSRLIGRHGQTLDALQSLVVTMTDRVTTDRREILLDVDGYRARRQDFLEKLAQRLTRKVRQTGKPVSSPPLPLSERRTLHELFKRESSLESRSKNHDGGRKVIILQQRA